MPIVKCSETYCIYSKNRLCSKDDVIINNQRCLSFSFDIQKARRCCDCKHVSENEMFQPCCGNGKDFSYGYHKECWESN